MLQYEEYKDIELEKEDWQMDIEEFKTVACDVNYE